MKFGLVTFPVHDGIPPAHLGRIAEDLGFESLFFTEHTHIPACRETPSPTGGELPPRYYHNYDPFVALSAVAAVTTTLLLGTGICLVVQRDPIILAKETASLDHMSGGRLLFGVGAGWNREEMRNHGTDPATRFRVLAERVKAIKAIWTQDEASFHGTYVDFDRIWSWPKPAQQPHPPVLVGGDGPRVIDRVVEYGDEWFPIAPAPATLRQRAAELRRRAEQAGRGPIPITVYGGPTDPERMAAYAEAGVHRVLVQVPTGPTEQVVPWLRDTAARLGVGR